MEKRRKKKLRILYGLLASLVVLILALMLLLHKPADYRPLKIIDNNHLSRYLTHELSPQLYNGIQLDEPFDLPITQPGLNDIVARASNYYNGRKRNTDDLAQQRPVSFSAPSVLFIPDSLILMATATMYGIDLVLTAQLNPKLNNWGLLNLQLEKIKIGALNVTPIARPIFKKAYLRQLSAANTAAPDIRTQVLASLFDDKPFEPTFNIAGKKVKTAGITITPDKLTLRLVPAYN